MFWQCCLCGKKWKTMSWHMWKSYLLIFLCMSDTCTSLPVIGCGCLQALKVAGVHLIMARKGSQAHPRKISPLNIFMYQVGLFISSLQLLGDTLKSCCYCEPTGQFYTDNNEDQWYCSIFILHAIAMTYSSPHTAPSLFSTIPSSPPLPPHFNTSSAFSLLSHRRPQHLQEASHL